MLIAACAHRPPVAPGAYHVELDVDDAVRTVSLELGDGGVAHLLATEELSIVPELDDDQTLWKDDHEEIEMRGRWTAAGDVRLEVVRACVWGIGEAPCAHPRDEEAWHLRCRPDGRAIRCRFVGLEPPPRFTVADGDTRYLVAGDWLRYTTAPR